MFVLELQRLPLPRRPSMTKEEILATKAEIEEHLGTVNALVEKLKTAGYNCRPTEGNKVYIFRTQVEEFGERPKAPVPPPEAA